MSSPDSNVNLVGAKDIQSPEHEKDIVLCLSAKFCKCTSDNCSQLALRGIYQWCCCCTARDDECQGCNELGEKELENKIFRAKILLRRNGYVVRKRREIE